MEHHGDSTTDASELDALLESQLKMEEDGDMSLLESIVFPDREKTYNELDHKTSLNVLQAMNETETGKFASTKKGFDCYATIFPNFLRIKAPRFLPMWSLRWSLHFRELHEARLQLRWKSQADSSAWSAGKWHTARSSLRNATTRRKSIGNSGYFAEVQR